MMADLPTFKAVEPVAVCGACGEEIFMDDECKARNPRPRPSSCCMNGPEYQNAKQAHSMRNMYIRRASCTAA